MERVEKKTNTRGELKNSRRRWEGRGHENEEREGIVLGRAEEERTKRVRAPGKCTRARISSVPGVE